MKNQSPKLTLVIPAYNEQENLASFLPILTRYCKEKNWNIIIVNDGSKDKTKDIIEKYKHINYFKVIHHKLNKGYGGAIKSGIMACETEYTITIDADGQHYLEDVDKLFNRIVECNADMVVGSRKGFRSSSYYREFGKLVIRSLAKLLMPIPIYDINSGMKIYRTDLAKKYLHLYPDSMAFSDIIALVFINNRHFVLEESIRINSRQGGKSTISVNTAFYTVMEILNIIILFNPLKIFLPASLIALLLGLFLAIRYFIINHGISIGASLFLTTGLLIFFLGLIAEQLSGLRKRNGP